ncbi:DUF2059 domain-containing protein [Thermodesulfobacteriota bacterium]
MAVRIPENIAVGQEVEVPVAVGYSTDSPFRPGKTYVARFKGVLANSRSGHARYDPATPQRPVDASTLGLTIVEGTYDIPETFSITFNEAMNRAKGYWKTAKGNKGTFTLYKSQRFDLDAQTTGKKLLNEIYVKSGLEKQIQQIPSNMQAGFDQEIMHDKNFRSLSRDYLSNIRGLIKKAYSSKDLKKTIVDQIEANITQDDIKEIIKWLDSPLGKKCTKLEEAISTTEALNEIKLFAAKVQESPPSADRIKLIQKLDSSLKYTETNVTISMNMQFALDAAIETSLPIENQKPLSEILERIKKRRPHIEAEMKPRIIVTLIYTYRSLSNFELEEYIKFAGSKLGVKYQRTVIEGIKNGLVSGSFKLGKSIGELMEETNKQFET